MEPNRSFEERFKESYTNKLSFHGKGSAYFGIVIVNLLLTIVTLGLYYPWAKAATRRYIWNESELNGSRFVFHGTGKEMFRGFVIVYGIFFSIFLVPVIFNFIPFLGLIMIFVGYILMLILIPFAIYGAWRYRLSRTSWRGIYFSFNGDFKEFLKLFFVSVLLTIITFGIYGAWMRVKIQKFLFSHTKFGNMKLGFHGEGADLFVINLLGFILSYITLGLYLPIFLKDRFNFTIDHLSLDDGKNKKLLVSHLKKNEAWPMHMSNFFILLFTAGLAFPWTFCRVMKMWFDNVEIPDVFNFDNLKQEADDYKDATGDEMLDVLDLGLDF